MIATTKDSYLKGAPVELDSATIPEIVARVAERNGDKPAVLELSENGSRVQRRLSRSGLDSLSTIIASNLIAKGVQAGDPVVVCADRCLETISAMVGILRAGGIFIPIDPDYPTERIRQMISVLSGNPIALVDQLDKKELRDSGLELVRIKDITTESGNTVSEFPCRSIDDPAYIMFTSGSTGEPKGVTVPHRAIKRLVAGDFATQDQLIVTLQLAPIAFDASTLEIWSPLLNGGQCVLYPGGNTPDLDILETILTSHGVTTLWLTSSLFNLIADIRIEILRAVSELIVGGEALSPSHVKKALAALPNTRLVNGYGPTENTTFTCCYQIPRNINLDDSAGIPLGTPIAGTDLRVCDAAQNTLPRGKVGELIVSGDGLALGYWKRDDLTAEKFYTESTNTASSARSYRTGDNGYIDDNGQVRFLGRSDDQIKLDGHRIELGEINEALRKLPGIDNAYTIVWNDDTDFPQLVSYVVAKTTADPLSIRKQLEQCLPATFIPSRIVTVDALPLSPVGKIDQSALPPPGSADTRENQNATPELENQIRVLWQQILSLPSVGKHDDFFRCGGTSMRALRFIETWKNTGNPPLTIAQMYEGATPAQLARAISEKYSETSNPLAETSSSDNVESNKIAIVGMAGKFPGADSVEQLWQMLLDGTEGTHFFSTSELDLSVRSVAETDPAYVAARGLIPGIENFDAERFGLNSREAELLDPQQRLLLEAASDTLESAGCDHQRFQGKIGVWAGTRTADYLQQIFDSRPDVLEKSGLFQINLANDKDFVANRIAYLLGLTGPAISVYSACSTSLVAVHEAARGLVNHECDLALAGGAAVSVPQMTGHIHQEGDILSADGHCKPFDASASGTLFNDGAAMVALKRLEDALRDGDRIHAVILGSAVNNDGGNKASFMAPSPDGQGKVITEAIKRSKIPAESIGFVEAHGTATPLGDPVEVEGLLRAFGNADKPSCVLGSIKSNIGHLTAAAGVAGLIKATLAVRENVIPATLHFKTPNRLLDFGGRFVVSEKAERFRPEGPRRAGISSFGVGGTNAHMVIEQPPKTKPEATVSPELRTPLLCLSAPHVQALELHKINMAECLNSSPHYAIDNVNWNLRTGRRQWSVRCASSGASRSEIISKLNRKTATGQSFKKAPADGDPSAVLIFPGQGSQYAGMGSDLVESEPGFAKYLSRCSEELGKFGDGMTLYQLLDKNQPQDVLAATRHAQPALFSIEYALARFWMDLGLVPRRMLGHSVGEFVAACLAEIFSLADALRLVVARGAIMDRMPRGEMLSVRMSPDELQLPDDIDLAAVNGASLCVVAGTCEAIASYTEQLDGKEIPNKRLQTSHAFHSRLMAPAVTEFRSIVEATSKNESISIPIQSTSTGKLLTPEQATSDQYWADHLRVPVSFSSAVKNLAEDVSDPKTWIECGPGKGAITSMVKSSLSSEKYKNDAFISGISVDTKSGSTYQKCAESVSFASAVGAAWCAGHDIPATHALGKGNRISIPTTPYDRKRCWLLDQPADSTSMSTIRSSTQTPANPAQPDRVLTPVGNTLDVITQVCELLSDLSGESFEANQSDQLLMELGFDSLLLTQAASAIRKEFGVDVSFRQLNEDFLTPKELAIFLEQQGAVGKTLPTGLDFSPEPLDQGANDILTALQQQLVSIQAQLTVLQKNSEISNTPVSASLPVKSSPSQHPSQTKGTESTKKAATANAHGPQLVINKGQTGQLTSRQEVHIRHLIEDYARHTKKSKDFTQANRSSLADPRTASGFSPRLKEITYPIVMKSSSGCHLIDIDDNDYVDLVSGFGSNFFGFGAPFVRDAVSAQMQRGMEIGPQSELVGEANSLFRQLVECERVAFCNTGSEAVLAALRLSRTVTGRDLVVVFTGGYHGIFDEVVARPTPRGSRPAAPGIPQGSVDNILVLPWDDSDSLDEIRCRGNEVAAVLVEPVQSRNPAVQPVEFLKQLRGLTREIHAALIFDEVVCGFRVAPGGAQERFGISADLCTYGKVVGGGMPIGVVAGSSQYMDALDGGFWSFGDDSNPTVGVTYFAGTFVRHPPALAAAISCMKYMLDKGPDLQKMVETTSSKLVTGLNKLFAETNAPLKVDQFSSVLRIGYTSHVPNGEILYHHLRKQGVHILDSRPVFLTMSHTDEDIQHVFNTFKNAIADLQSGGFYPETINQADPDKPPVSGAKLGRNPAGDPTWYVPDPDSPSGFRAISPV